MSLGICRFKLKINHGGRVRNQAHILKILALKMELQRFIKARNDLINGLSLRYDRKVDAFANLLIFAFVYFKLKNVFHAMNLP